MKNILLLTLLLSTAAISEPEAFRLVKQHDNIKVYVTCVEGYLWNVTVIDTEHGVAVDSQQMSVPSDKGMVTTPVPVKCK